MKAPWSTVTAPPSSAIGAATPASGEFITTPYSSTGSSNFSNLGYTYFARVDLPKSQSFTGLATWLTILAVGGTTPLVRMGVYADDGNLAKPVGTGPIAGTAVSFDPTGGSTGLKDIAFSSPVTLVGSVWLAWMLVSGSALSTPPGVVNLNSLIMPPLTTTTLNNGNYHTRFFGAATNASALPDVTTPPTLLTNPVPMTALKAA